MKHKKVGYLLTKINLWCIMNKLQQQQCVIQVQVSTPLQHEKMHKLVQKQKKMH